MEPRVLHITTLEKLFRKIPPGWATLPQVYPKGPGGRICKSLRTVLPIVAVVLSMISLELTLSAQRGSDGCPDVRRTRPAALSGAKDSIQFVPPGRLALPQHMRGGRFRPLQPPHPPGGPCHLRTIPERPSRCPARSPSVPSLLQTEGAMLPSAHSPAFSSVTLAIFQLLPASRVC